MSLLSKGLRASSLRPDPPSGPGFLLFGLWFFRTPNLSVSFDLGGIEIEKSLKPPPDPSFQGPLQILKLGPPAHSFRFMRAREQSSTKRSATARYGPVCFLSTPIPDFLDPPCSWNWRYVPLVAPPLLPHG